MGQEVILWPRKGDLEAGGKGGISGLPSCPPSPAASMPPSLLIGQSRRVTATTMPESVWRVGMEKTKDSSSLHHHGCSREENRCCVLYQKGHCCSPPGRCWKGWEAGLRSKAPQPPEGTWGSGWAVVSGFMVIFNVHVPPTTSHLVPGMQCFLCIVVRMSVLHDCVAGLLTIP